MRRVPVLTALIRPNESWHKLKSSKLTDERLNSTVAEKLSVSRNVLLSGQDILACGLSRSYEAVRVAADLSKIKREGSPLIDARDGRGSDPKFSSSNVSALESATDAHKTVRGNFNDVVWPTGRLMCKSG